MNYRDDRDALRSEVENLQQELGAARADQQRLQHIEQRLEAAKREMEALEGELERARGKRKRTGPPPALFAGIAIAIVAMGAGFFFVMKSSPAPAPVVVVSPPQPVQVTPPPTPVPVPEPPHTVDPLPPAEVKSVLATWSASVTQSTDASLHAGTKCKIEALVVPDSSGAHVKNLTVECGNKTIYDEKAPLNGMSMLDSGATQRAGTSAGSWVYDFYLSDVGARGPSRAQAKLDSAKKIGRVWSEDLPELKVDLAIVPGSGPVSVQIIDK